MKTPRTPGQHPDSPSRKSGNDAGTIAGPQPPECPYELLDDLAEFVEYVQSLAHIASQFDDDCDFDLEMSCKSACKTDQVGGVIGVQN